MLPQLSVADRTQTVVSCGRAVLMTGSPGSASSSLGVYVTGSCGLNVMLSSYVSGPALSRLAFLHPGELEGRPHLRFSDAIGFGLEPLSVSFSSAGRLTLQLLPRNVARGLRSPAVEAVEQESCLELTSG